MYRALYRKWRPLTFQDVVGQTAIVTALRNQIATQHVGHAYLFTGVRGTGKTSCAKIFAKAINCMHPVAGDPCGKCEACVGIENGSILDVVEMDAASNNGVDNIRDLRDETAYTPSACNYKVFIIDEVHMLSPSAFNALLKTLEEPPAHIVFILATTEIQKVPATILSRCQRYDFTRIQPSDLAARAMMVANAEGFTLTEGAADLIARLADGAARDTLSILDTCAGVTTEIDEDTVRRMAGVTDRSYLFQISSCIAKDDSVGALAELAMLRQKSVDLKRLAEELILHYRNLMLAALPNGSSLLSGVSPEEEAQYLVTCKEIPQAQSVQAIRALGNALEKMTRGGDQRIELELAFFGLTEPASVVPVANVGHVPASAAASAAPVPFASAPAATATPAPFTSAPVASAAPAPFTSAPAAATAPTPPISTPTATTAPTPALSTSVPVAPIAPAPVAVAPASATPSAPIENTTPSSAVENLSMQYSDNDAPPLDSDAPPLDFDMPATAIDAPIASAPASAYGAPRPAPSTTAAKQATITATTAPTSDGETVLAAVAARRQRPKAEKPVATTADSHDTETSTDALIPFPAWKEVQALISKKDPMLYGHLRRSTAYRQGNRVLIDANLAFRNFIRVNKTSQALIKDLIFSVTEERLAIGPYEPQTTPITTINAEDSLRALGAKGVEISIKD